MGSGNPITTNDFKEKENAMGLLDQLKEGLTAKQGGGSDLSGMLEQAMSLIYNPATGGVVGLVEAFKRKDWAT